MFYFVSHVRQLPGKMEYDFSKSIKASTRKTRGQIFFWGGGDDNMLSTSESGEFTN